MKDSTRRWWAMAAISVSVLVVSLDLTVLSLALPTIAATMHASTGDLQWITDAYALVIAALILPAGLLGDRYGRKKVLLAALVLFVASSVWCAYSVSVGELIAARAVLGIGAAAVFPMAISVIPVMFGEQERQKAISVMAASLFLAYPIGPIVGGFLLNHFWWGSVFLINVPIVVIALAAVTFLLPESRAAKRPRLDFPGIVISSAGLTALTYGFIRAGQSGWTDALALTTIVAGLAILVGFVWWERFTARRTGAQPLIDLSLFRVASFRWGTLLMTFVSFAMFGLFFTAPQYFQDVRGATPLGSGLRLLPLIGGMLVGMVAAGRLTNATTRPDGSRGDPRVSAKLAVTVGFLVMAAGLAIGAGTGLGSSSGYAALWITVTGLGLGIAMPSAMNAAVGPLTAERSASGGALMSAVRQVGATIGVAVLGTLISNGYTSRLHLSGLPSDTAAAARSSVAGGVAVAQRLGSTTLLDTVRSAFIHGMDIMLWTCGGIALASALLALAFLPRRFSSRPGAAPTEPADSPVASEAQLGT
jgi:MFS transporter, DHA2 family, multidrug resistance protein